MGEETIPQWTIPPGDVSLNSKFKNTYKIAKKIVLDQVQKQKTLKRPRDDA
jgi:hypothetical protein